MNILGLEERDILPRSWQDVVDFIKREDVQDEDPMLQTNNPDKLKDHLRDMKRVIKKQIEDSRKLSTPPFLFGIVVATDKKDDKNPTAVILQSGRLLEVYLPKDKDILPGHSVKISSQTMQIVDWGQEYPFGDIGLVRHVIDNKTSEITYNNGKRVVLNGSYAGKIEAGDRVVLDSSASIIVMSLGKSEQRFLYGCESDVTWESIGGQNHAKNKLKEALELPYSEKDLFKFYNKKTPKGFLLVGPPGCGKTMLIEAAANSIAKTHGQKSATGFIFIKGAQILEPLVGVAEQTLEQIFITGEEHFKKNGFPAIIAIDEAEALLRKRGSGKSSDIETTIVPVFLSQVNNSHSIVILATNKPEMLDEAVTRDKRINHIIEVGRPDPESAKAIALINLKDVPLFGLSKDEMIDYIVSELYSPNNVLYDVTKVDGQKITINLSHIINGAMISGTIDDAVSVALDRDRQSGKQTGVTTDDVKKAVQGKVKAQLLLDHSHDIAEFVKDFVDDVISVTQRQIR